jgi:hypothetical protein
MAPSVKQPWESKAPTIIRNLAKPRVAFICNTCFREVTGWEYFVGYDPMNKIRECSECWAQPRIPPMKPLGLGVIYG